MELFDNLFDLNGDGKGELLEELIGLDLLGFFDDEKDSDDDDDSDDGEDNEY